MGLEKFRKMKSQESKYVNVSIISCENDIAKYKENVMGRFKMDTDIVEIDCEIIHRTDNAVLIEIGTDEYWLPKSKISCVEGVENFELTTIEVEEWLAIEKGLV